MSQTMKAAFARGGAGIDAIALREVDVPSPGPGEALVRLRAATLNFRDLLFSKGGLTGTTKEPEYVPLSCASGEVAALGEGVGDLKLGDRVNPLFFQDLAPGATMSMHMLGGSVDGVARQYGVFAVRSLCRIPDELGDLEAATLPCAGLTAWAALFGERPLQPGERVLLQGTGGVSIAALQWAKAAGAEVVVISSSDAKLRRAKSLGADVLVNYRTHPDWPEAARAASGGRGVDILIDNIGASQLDAAASVVNPGGVVATVGLLEGESSRGKTTSARTIDIAVGSREQHEAMTAFAVRHHIRPVVDAVYDLDRLTDALHHQESGRFFGKIGINLL